MNLLPRHSHLEDHSLLFFVIDQEMSIEEEAAAFLQVSARDGLTPRTVGIEGRRPQDDVLAVECPVALAD